MHLAVTYDFSVFSTPRSKCSESNDPPKWTRLRPAAARTFAGGNPLRTAALELALLVFTARVREGRDALMAHYMGGDVGAGLAELKVGTGMWTDERTVAS